MRLRHFILISSLTLTTCNSKDKSDEYTMRDIFKQDSLKFNSIEWKKSVDNVDAVRPYMLDDLRKNILKTGLNKPNIETLLGETLPWDKEGKRLYYRIGIFQGMEPTYLVIELDENGEFKTSSLHDY